MGHPAAHVIYRGEELGRQLGWTSASAGLRREALELEAPKVRVDKQRLKELRGLGLAPVRPDDPVVAGVVERWRALTDAGRNQTPLVDMVEERLEEEGRAVREGGDLAPGLDELLRAELPALMAHLVAQGIYSDNELGRQLGINNSRAGRLRDGLELVPPEVRPDVVAKRRRELGLGPAPVRLDDPIVAGVVERWRALPDAGRDETPLLGLLEQALADEGRAVREGRRFAAGVAEVLQRQTAWLLERGDYSGDELGGQLGVHAEVAGVWRRELELVRLDEPVVAGVVEQWQGLTDEGRVQTPLLGSGS